MGSNYFVFKGERDYLHSASLFDYILAQLETVPTRIDFRFSRRTAQRCRLITQRPHNDSLVASYEDAGNRLYAVETGQAITDRVLYDEDAIAAHFTLDGNAVLVATACGYSFIECAVAGYKRLLISLYGKKRFAFVRVVLARIPEGPFKISFARELGGNFYEGKISEDGVGIGGIFYGTWR
jgi:hypothetical protein